MSWWLRLRVSSPQSLEMQSLKSAITSCDTYMNAYSREQELMRPAKCGNLPLPCGGTVLTWTKKLFEEDHFPKNVKGEESSKKACINVLV